MEKYIYNYLIWAPAMELTIHEKYLLLLQISQVHRMVEFILGTCRFRHVVMVVDNV